jgi:alkylhydroperoxidase/carboxymuconolactone decarboxylase family protein YurZ
MAAQPESLTSQLMQLSPEIRESHLRFASGYQEFFKSAFDQGALDAKTLGAVALAVALVHGREETVRSYLAAAKQFGLSNPEVAQTAAIVEALKLDAELHPAASVATAPVKKANTCC